MNDLRKKADDIYHKLISPEKKIKLLDDLILECYSEMEAQDENMHPEIKHNAGEGLRVAKNYLRELDKTRAI